jgi:hypothetical protein
MAKMDELFNDMYDYCENSVCWWDYWMTAKEWNESLGKNYTGASFTALVNWGKLERRQARNNTKAYEYRIAPVGKMKEKFEEDKRRSEIKDAERIIKYHDENVARIKARYEEMIKQAEEQFKRYMDFEAEKMEKAKAILAENK